MWRRLARLAPYHAHFLGSGSHAWLALLTLGVGIAVATPLSLALGLGAYGLGLVFLPDLGPFKRRYDELRARERQALLEEERLVKSHTRSSLESRLSKAALERRTRFSRLCQELRDKLGESRVEVLMEEESLARIEDSHLLLLAMEADIRAYQANAEPASVTAAKAATLENEVSALRNKEGLSDVHQRLLLSKEETLRSLRQQAEQQERMGLNLELALSELQRLESQLASLKAELISQPASQLSSRLGETLVQVEASQRVLKEGGMVATPDLNTLLGERA